MDTNHAIKILKCFVDREKIKELHAAGMTNRQIAKTLGVHHRTISNHLKAIGLNSNFANESIDIVSDTEARCKKCQEIKPLLQFQYGRKGQKYEYRFAFCNECRKKQIYLNLNKDVNKFLADRFNRLKRRAKQNNIVCTISKEDFINQYHSQNGLCFYSDVKMVCEVGSDLHRDSLSIDKLIPEKGYVKNNIVFATHRINTCKCDLSLAEIQKWMPGWFERIKEFIKE